MVTLSYDETDGAIGGFVRVFVMMGELGRLPSELDCHQQGGDYHRIPKITMIEHTVKKNVDG